MKLLILISALAVVNSKPHTPGSSSDEAVVQIEKQEVQEITHARSKTLFGNAEDAKRAQNTKEILDKIVEVNRRHGLTPKGLKTNQDYVQLPTVQRSGTAKQQNFQFAQNPFSNPIFDYLNTDNSKTRQNPIQPASFSTINTNAEINPEDNIPGQFIKRKITHHQTFIVPMAGGMGMGMGNYNPTNNGQMMGNYNPTNNGPMMENYNPTNNGPMMGNYNPTNHGPMVGNYNPTNNGQVQNMWYPNQPLPQNPQMMQYNPSQLYRLEPPLQTLPQPQNEAPSSSNSSNPDNLKKALENQTVENIKNIVNRELPPQMPFTPYNTYPQNQIPQYYQYYPFYHQPSDNQPLNSYSYRTNGPNAKIPNEYMLQQLSRPGRQWQWPLAQYFPIVIKDPLQQIFNAFTSMIEYGQESSAHCADEQRKNDETASNSNRLGKNLKQQKNDQTINDNKPIIIDIEDLEMNKDPENPMKLTVKYSTSSDTDRTEKQMREEPRVNTKLSQFSKTVETKSQQTTDDILRSLINIKNKKKEAADHVKLFSKDSTGSGVFIHKLRVRKGGVAIAGPGGIATAGSGGTAIVGPNGYAYTQPDSIAIAGSGTKVIAVDPGVDLTELIENVQKDKTGAVNPRLGKIVAIGPTVYYNKG